MDYKSGTAFCQDLVDDIQKRELNKLSVAVLV